MQPETNDYKLSDLIDIVRSELNKSQEKLKQSKEQTKFAVGKVIIESNYTITNSEKGEGSIKIGFSAPCFVKGDGNLKGEIGKENESSNKIIIELLPYKDDSDNENSISPLSNFINKHGRIVVSPALKGNISVTEKPPKNIT